MSLQHKSRRSRMTFHDTDATIRPVQTNDFGTRGDWIGVAYVAGHGQDVHVGIARCCDTTDMRRPFADRQSQGGQRPPRWVIRVQHVGDFCGRYVESAPSDVVRQSREQQHSTGEPAHLLDDVPSLLVFIGVGQVRMVGQLANHRQNMRIRRVADDELLEAGRLNFGLKPSQNDLIVCRWPKVLHDLRLPGWRVR